MSGTHVAEMNVWKAAGITPDGEKDAWYTVFSLGKLGNGHTTEFTNRRGAYTLMDRATYLTKKNKIDIVPLVEGDPILLNLIAAIEVSPKRFPNVNNKDVVAFVDWLCGDEAQTIIKDFKVDQYGEPLFFRTRTNGIRSTGNSSRARRRRAFSAAPQLHDMSTPLYEIHNLRQSYEKGRPNLDIAELSIDAGCVTGVVGPNGGGKSTLLKVLAFLIPASGEIISTDCPPRGASARFGARSPICSRSRTCSSARSLRTSHTACGCAARRSGSSMRACARA